MMYVTTVGSTIILDLINKLFNPSDLCDCLSERLVKEATVGGGIHIAVAQL